MFSLPWRLNPANLPDNYCQAKAKLVSTEKRLLKNQDHAKQYNEQIAQLVESGSAKILTKDEMEKYNGPMHYISHHAVYRPEKLTHPCRLVFNSASSYKGHVLNEYLAKCGDHLNGLVGVLIRWRENEFTIVGDISRMYHQVLTNPATDVHTHRFLWRNFENKDPDVYVKLVLTFGDISSPAIANIALDMTAEEKMSEFPDSCTSVIENRYMDDILDSLKSEVEAVTRAQQIDEILKSGHFKVKGWISNGNIGSVETPETMKVLGVNWNTRSDQISIVLNPPKTFEINFCELTDPKFEFTKRICLSALASTTDVFGIGAPVIIRGKILMQELWSEKVDWDETLSSRLALKWSDWFRDLRELGEIEVHRCLTPPSTTGLPDLVIFCDGSKLAFGAVAYLRWRLENGTFDTRFVLAKSRVAPLKELTAAKLELQGAVLAARITDTIRTESRMEFGRMFHFTDSMIVLGQIKNESKSAQTFVATRIGEIQTKTNLKDWYHITTDLNVADELSRGIKTSELCLRFEKGSDFLFKPAEEWTVTSECTNTDVNDLSLKSRVHVATENKRRIDLPGIENSQPLHKAIKVTAFVLRFLNNFIAKYYPGTSRKVRKGPKGSVEADELNYAEQFLVRIAQCDLPDTYRDDFKTLSPFEDQLEIVRVGGRLANSEVSYDQRHPVLLPYGHWFCKLLVRNAHSFGHSGVNTTSAKVRKNYWIIGVNRMSRSVVYKCVFCREMRAETETQYMADLPASRSTPSPPFHRISCDLFGPFNVKVSRNVKKKYWGVIFTCLSTRAVYADVTADYSAQEFTQTFRRFIAIHGSPETCLSDRGSQLVAASKDIQEWCTSENRRIKWEFTTPKAAHQNGAAESLVKSMKKAIAQAVGDTTLTALELQTVMLEACNLVNERPIGTLSNDPNDGSYISPNDILLGRSSSNIPHGPFTDTDNPRYRVEFCQNIVTSFWKKWYRDVFPNLTFRKKWHTSRRNLCIDDFVITEEKSPERGTWIKARVSQIYPGPDGVVRNVRVRTAKGMEYDRPTSKIVCLLPVEEQ